MHPLARQRIQVGGQHCNQGLTLTCAAGLCVFWGGGEGCGQGGVEVCMYTQVGGITALCVVQLRRSYRCDP
jgi:hypothetical protein